MKELEKNVYPGASCKTQENYIKKVAINLWIIDRYLFLTKDIHCYSYSIATVSL